MSKLPIISPGAVPPPTAATGSKAAVPVPAGRPTHEPRPLLPIEGYRTRQFGAEARRSAAQFDRSDLDAGVILDAEFTTGGLRTGDVTTAAFSAQVLGRSQSPYATGLRIDPSAMALGSEAYRRAGAEPSLASEAANAVNLSV